MAEPARVSVPVLFGPFEVSPDSGELRKNGTRLKLTGQAIQVLITLLERPGQLVTREELQQKLWPGAGFGDFEHGLNAAVKRLRDTLGDSAENPAFIETVPRKGYKFIAPVELIGRDGFRPAAVTQPVREGRNSALVIAAVSMVALLVLAGVIVWRSLPRLHKVTNVAQVTNDAKAKVPMNLFVTDGVHLYFIEGTPWAGGSAIAQVSASGGETTRIDTPLKELLAIHAISPDFSELLVANGVAVQADPATGRSNGAAELWAQPLPAGTPHRVGKFYATDACYTPDGMHILYADGHAFITVNRDGSDPHELAKIQGIVRGIRYSPDGRGIRFHVHTGPPFENSSLWEMDADGNGLHPLLPNWKGSAFQCCGTWSPDGNYYFFRGGFEDDQAIWVWPEHRFILGNGTPSRLISGPLRLGVPVASTDGKKLFVMGEQRRVEPVLYDSKSRRFESYLNGISTSSFDTSHDRKWVAYVSYPDLSLWRMRTNGTDRMQLTFPPVRAYGPSWSPDDSTIGFLDVRFGRPWTASLVSSSGGPPQLLHGDQISWLPDGRSYISVRTQPNDLAPFAGIFRFDVYSGKTSLIPGSEGLYSARASPDGRYIAAFSQAATELLLFDSKTKQWSSLAKGELFSYNLWSHDGKYVYMRDSHSGSPRIVRVRIPDGRMEEVVSLKDLPQVVDIFAGWIGLTPDDQPIVIRDRSTQEIYALDLR